MARSLRVAIVGPYPPVEGGIHGGVQAATSALADGLADVENVEVHAVTCVEGLKHPQDRMSSGGVHVHLLPLFGKLGCLTGFAVDGRRIRAALRRISPDIVHVHTSLVYAHAALERGWPSILTMHGIYYRETASKRGVDWLQTRLGCAYEINAVRRARHIIAINHYSTNAYTQYIRTNDICYIDNPINDRYFSIPGRAEPGRILFGGFICDLKNLLYLLEAIAILAGKYPHIGLRVAGAVRERDYYERCLSFISMRGIEKNVEFLGAVSTDGMLEEQARASLLVLTSKQENAPVIISESMAAGIPVIATDVGGVSEMVDHGKSGFVVPLDDPEELAARIDCLLTDEQLRKQMGETGKMLAEGRFRRSVVVQKTIEFYEDVVNGERKARN